MDPTNGKSSEFERRTSMRQSVRISAAPGDDDDFGLAAMGISDGFRPSQEPGPPSSLSSGPATPNNEATQQTTDGHETHLSSSRPSSIAKTRHNESFSLRHDGQMGPINETALSRHSTTSNEDPFVAAEAVPYTGSPSDPFISPQPCPHNVPNNGTDSIAPIPEPSYTGPRQPTHPYGMYPQNTGTDGDGAGVVAQPIPVGFPGTTDQYRRRIGPEGEDVVDLIGPDGHTEELPPYTRYPDEAYARKVGDDTLPVAVGSAPMPMPMPTAQPIQAQPPATQVQDNVAAIPPQPLPEPTAASPTLVTVASTASTATAPESVISGAGGMGLATRDPEFSSSTDDLASTRSRYSAQSFGTQASAQKMNAAAALSNNEKLKQKWKKKASKRLCGIIPYWAICLVFGVLGLMGIILGSVIGTFLAKQKPPPRKDQEGKGSAFPATITITPDATPLSTAPANLRPLDEGDFSLPIVSAARSSKSCFNNTLQSNAWSCNIVFSQLMMSISEIKNNPEISNYAVNLSCNQSLTLDSNTFSYGTQPPCFNQNHTMELVTDIYEPNRGPAWFFQMPYKKVVILPESFLSVDDSEEAAATEESVLKERFSERSSFKRKGIANPGEKPWICTWDGTMLEVFVYANQDSNSYRGYTSMSALGASYIATATNNPFVHSPTSSSSTSSSESKSHSDDKTEESAYIQGTEKGFATGTMTTATAKPTDSETADSNTNTTYAQWDIYGPKLPPPPYPRVVKIEERRMNGDPSQVPICQQWEILENGRVPVRDEFGREVIIEIGETEPDPTPVNADELFPEETAVAGSKAKRMVTRKTRSRIDPRVLEERTGGSYFFDTEGNLRERGQDTILVGQDLSDCGCLWWTL